MTRALYWSSLVWLLALGACGAASTNGNDGSSGAAGDGGDAGSAGAAEAGTFRPPVPITGSPETLGASPVKCAGTPKPEASVLQACVLSAGCSPYLQDEPLSDCIAEAVPNSGALPACVNAATNCADFSACVGSGFYSGACPLGAMGTTCVGSNVVDCSNVPHTFVDCAKRGASCVAYSSSGNGTNDAADCAVEATCTGPAAFVCDGTKRVLCSQGIGFGEDCAARGLGCVTTPNGAVCALASAGCAQPEVGSCDIAGKGSYCTTAGQTLSFDCARLGLTCQIAPDRTHGLECINSACAADDAAQCFEECDGPLAHLCLAGERLSIDCRSYGFPSCILETRPDVGERARCGRH